MRPEVPSELLVPRAWPGHTFEVDDLALCVYLSTTESGQRYALEIGKNYAAWSLAAPEENRAT